MNCAHHGIVQGIIEIPTADDISKHLQLIRQIRKNSQLTSAKADKKMIDASMANNPPARYAEGENVIIRRFSSSSKRKSAKDKWNRFVKGTIIKYSPKSCSYKVEYTLDGKSHAEWFKVSDLTSLTFHEELNRHQAQEGMVHRIFGYVYYSY